MGNSRIAYVCGQRQIHVLEPDGQHIPQTVAAEGGLMWGSWQAQVSEVVAHSWPTWSPDGKSIACFRMPASGAPRVLVTQVNGIESTEFVDLGVQLPIYLYWSPTGNQLAILTQQLGQDGDKLGLLTLRADATGSTRSIAEGTPLFFTWFGERIAAFVGKDTHQASTLSVIDPTGRIPTQVLPGVPGNFCAPVALKNHILYVAHYNGASRILRAKCDEPTPQCIETVDGLVGLVASPDRSLVARAVAPGGDGTAYRNLALIDSASGEIRNIVDLPCLGFFWTPDNSALMTVSVDTSRNLMTWARVTLDGDIDPIAEMIPTRDYGFYLRFFEQYSQSHPIIDPTSQHFLACGEMLGELGSSNKASVWTVPLNGSKPTEVAEGVFAVYSHQNPPGS